MQRTLPVFFLFILIVLEGYVVLSSELLAIRQSIPFVGSGTDTVSIIIAAVLMPLAFGYQAGGNFKPGFRRSGKYYSIRQKLIANLFVSMCILFFGMSHAAINIFFITLINSGISDRLVLATIYATLFLVTPVYLLGQTIPLISNYFSKERLSKITGKILFFSTLGSFLGATFSTLVLMATIGVHYTAALNFVILAALIMLISKRKFSELSLISVCIAAAAIYVNSDTVMRAFNIVENNKYNTIAVIEENGSRELILNNNASSKYTDDGRKHEYIEFIEEIAIKPTLTMREPKDILVIGAGAFTLGFEDGYNQYDYLDIDESLKEISEEYILKSKLKDNKTFHPVPARAFLAGTDKTYDLIILDAYLGDLTLPEHLVTKEFFESIKTHLNEGGVVIANFIAGPNFANKFSRNLDNTLRSVFPHISRQALKNRYRVWNIDPNLANNIIYIYSDHKDANASSIYTDDKNRVFYDKPNKRTQTPEYEEE